MEQLKEDELAKLQEAEKSGKPQNFVEQLRANFIWSARALDDEWKPRHLIRWKNTLLKQLTKDMNAKQEEAWTAVRRFNDSVNLREACRQYLESYFERCIPVTPNSNRQSGDEDEDFIQLPPCKCIYSTGTQPSQLEINTFNVCLPRRFSAALTLEEVK